MGPQYRKIIQVCPGTKYEFASYLCDDGTVWCLDDDDQWSLVDTSYIEQVSPVDIKLL